jgi:1-acyl-sn-glycerol-3-phosphate acyltransferase
VDRKNHRIVAVLKFPLLLAWLILSTVVYGTATIVGGIFSKRLAQFVGRSWCRHLLFSIGVRLEVRGDEKLAAGRTYVFFANHQSALDIPIIYTGLPQPLCFIAKKELFLIPFFGWGMAAMGHVRIDRSSARNARESLTRGVARLKRHRQSLILFPEGTRSIDGRLGEFKQGSFSLALDAGAPVVPVAIRKANERLPKKSLIVRPGTVFLDICEPIEAAGMDKSELAGKVRREIAKIVETEER